MIEPIIRRARTNYNYGQTHTIYERLVPVNPLIELPKEIKKLEELPSLTEIDTQIAEQSLSEFIKQAWPIIEPNTRYKHNWHIDLVSEYLQEVEAGNIKRLIVNFPPRHMKSILISVMFPAWVWLKHPHTRWLCASYGLALALKHNMDRRTIIESEWYQERWGNIVKLSEELNQKTEFQNTARGHMMATSVGGSATGRGGSYIVIDDPLNPEESLSDTRREAANRWIDQTLSTRLDDKQKDKIVIVMQRLHHDDTTGHLLKKNNELGEPDWTHLSIPAEAPKKTMIVYPISKKNLIREMDQVLWEEREPKTVLDQQKRSMGTWAYSGQYQQEPVPLGGGIIQKDWIKYYQNDLPPISVMQIIQSWDMNFKAVGDSSFVVGQVWGRLNADKFLLDQYRNRIGFTETIRAVKAMTTRWPQTQSVLIEDKANGPAVIDSLRHEISGIVAINPEGSKESRLQAVSPQFESGNIYMPHTSIAPWVEQYLDELCNFPFTAHDDQVDSTSQALNWMPKHSLTMAEFSSNTSIGGRLVSATIDW